MQSWTVADFGERIRPLVVEESAYDLGVGQVWVAREEADRLLEAQDGVGACLKAPRRPLAGVAFHRGGELVVPT